MTIGKIPSELYSDIFAFLEERDIHAVSKTSKDLRSVADDNAVWARFLEKRFILVTDDNKRRLTHFFHGYCQYFAGRFSEINFSASLVSPTHDVFDLYTATSRIVKCHAKPRVLDRLVQAKPEELQFLLDAGAKIQQGIDQEHPGTLNAAIVRDASSESVRILLAAGARPNMFPFYNISLSMMGTLNLALAETKPLTMIECIYKAGGQITQTEFNGIHYIRGSLDTAARQHGTSVETLQFLLQHRAQLSEDTVVGERRLKGTLSRVMSWHDPNPAVLLLLLKAGAQPNRWHVKRSLLNPDALKLLLDSGIKLTTDALSEILNELVLFQRANLESLKLLLSAGARPTNVNSEVVNHLEDDDYYACTLDYAIRGFQSIDVVRMLLKAGALPTQTRIIADERGEREQQGSLDLAIRQRLSYEIIQTILDGGAGLSRTIDTSMGRYFGSLDKAVSERDCDVRTIEVLLRAGAQPSKNTLQLAISSQSDEIIALLLNAHAEITESAPNILGSLDFAINERKPASTIRLLLQAGATPSNKSGLGTLDLALSRECQPEVVRLLLDARAIPHQRELRINVPGTPVVQGTLGLARYYRHSENTIQMLEETIRIQGPRPMAIAPPRLPENRVERPEQAHIHQIQPRLGWLATFFEFIDHCWNFIYTRIARLFNN